jgi:hypothetical protein
VYGTLNPRNAWHSRARGKEIEIEYKAVNLQNSRGRRKNRDLIPREKKIEIEYWHSKREREKKSASDTRDVRHSRAREKNRDWMQETDGF